MPGDARGKARFDVAARVLVLAHSDLVGRRLVGVLRRDGFVAVASRRIPPADALPDVVVVVNDGEATDTMLDVVRRLDGIPIVVVGAASRRTADQAVDAGARGFVSDVHAEARLASTARAVLAGQLVIPAEFREPRTALLSSREKQVLSMVVLGFTNVDIANRLFLSESTVKSHLNSAYRKLGVRSRQQATARILGSTEGLGLGILSLTEAPATP